MKTVITETAVTSPSPKPRKKKRLSWQRREKLIAELMKPNLESAIEVFDFEKNWDLVRPHLRNPRVEAALVKEGFNLQTGPWADSVGDYWLDELCRRANEAIATGRAEFQWRDDEIETEAGWERWKAFERRFSPKPDTLEWYQCKRGCHWLAPFLEELGRLIFPGLVWKRMTGVAHSMAYGADETGNIKIIFDILYFKEMSAMELIAFAARKHPNPVVTLADIAAAEQKLLSE